MKYIEFRPLESDRLSCIASITGTEHFCFQSIDLRNDIALLYRGMHDSCIRRKIKRAEKEKLFYEQGSSDRLLCNFRYLFLLTRRRHRLPPPPASWFNNLAHFLGDRLKIHMVSKNDKPIASILTLTHRHTIVYKYGCSDSSFSNMGGTPYLFWKVIQQAKETGFSVFDLGRSDYEDDGLIAFKEHLGATAKDITYFRGSHLKNERLFPKTGAASLMRYTLSRLPDPLLAGIGNILYRHIG
jgi:lipid II:glycine glycyltransferase (peptidoglycan interpeptide bridge formation enzyme)